MTIRIIVILLWRHLSQPKSEISDLGHLMMPNAGKPELGAGRGEERPWQPYRKNCLVPAYSCKQAAKQTWRGGVRILHGRCGSGGRRCAPGRAVILAPMSREHHAALGDVALRTNESMVLAAGNSIRGYV
jgi:hypothetical protein